MRLLKSANRYGRGKVGLMAMFRLLRKTESKRLTTHGLVIRLCAKHDAKVLTAFYQDNAEHLRRWEPQQEHTLGVWQKRLAQRLAEQRSGDGAYFIACDAKTGEVSATCSLTYVMSGVFQACYMGYAVGKKYEGQGVMKQTCLHAIDYAFNTLDLNRIMANYIPHNKRSESLLRGLGFVREGFAKRYLFINGQWEDHVLTSLLRPTPN